MNLLMKTFISTNTRGPSSGIEKTKRLRDVSKSTTSAIYCSSLKIIAIRDEVKNIFPHGESSPLGIGAYGTLLKDLSSHIYMLIKLNYNRTNKISYSVKKVI